MMPNDSGQAGTFSEEIQDRIRQASEVAEFFNDRQCVGYSNLAKRYVHGHVYIRMTVRAKDGYCAALLMAERCAKNLGSPHVTTPDSETRHSASGGDDISMFALVAEEVQGIQKVIPTLVRSKAVYDCDMWGGEFANLPLRPTASVIRFCVGDGECAISDGFGPVLFRKRRDQMIQAVPLGGDYHSSGGDDAIRDLPRELNLDVDIPGLGIDILPNAIGLSFSEQSDFSLKDCDLRICPVDFRPSAG